jgi:hypothetical protein
MIINFVITKNNHKFSDALILPDDHTYTDAELEAMKQARFDKWYTIITTPVENPNPDLEPEPQV